LARSRRWSENANGTSEADIIDIPTGSRLVIHHFAKVKLGQHRGKCVKRRAIQSRRTAVDASLPQPRDGGAKIKSLKPAAQR
jgi:hypothetical protein